MDKTTERLIEYHIQLKLTTLIDNWLSLLEQKKISPELEVVQALRQAVSLIIQPDETLPQTDLAAAATMLVADYQQDSELMAFTSLDGEDFHA